MLSEGNAMPECERVEALRSILEREQCRPISYAEAAEVGESLMNFFETLAEGMSIDDTSASQQMKSELVGAR
jgi:hypothetical protein